MDPNATLSAAREAAAAVFLALQNADDNAALDSAGELASAVTALDEWLSKRGFLPDDWRTPPVPEYGVNPLVDQLLWDVFVTALEGGIGYWAASRTYHLWREDSIAEDYEGFHADIVDAEYQDAFEPTRIDRSTMVKAFERLADGPGEYIPEHMRQRFLAAMHARLGKLSVDFDFDASDADCLVQIGLFGKVIFG